MANQQSKTEQKEAELEKKLAQIQSHGKEDEYKALAQKLGLPFSTFSSVPIDANALVLVPEETARAGQFAVILRNGSELTVATVNPENASAKEAWESLTHRGFKLTLIITSPAALEYVFKRYNNIKGQEMFEVGSLEISEEELNALQAQIKTVADLKNQVSAVSATKLLEILLAGALKTHASDIHFEPGTDATRLRYRLDGVLEDVTTVDTGSYEKVLNRIKVLSRLKLNVHSAPQDGRFTIKQKSADIEVRVSILPSEYGETIVMRLLDPREIKGTLGDLGMRQDLLDLVKAQLDKPTGAILTTGPTGSGKTTTLYAFINYLNSTGSKIITIEDPIEYHITGISQTQVEPKKGYTFANGLRAIVRQDPDIILVGEIRDAETAGIALQAALTGHLVLSTIHTNDAAGTIPRLIDIGIMPQVIAPAIRIAMAQRLIRKLCTTCKKSQPVTAEELKKIKADLEPLTGRLKFATIDEKLNIYSAVGCAACNNTGYQGRVGVFEAFTITNEMERLILSSPPISAMQELAVNQGMITMHQDAYLKLIEGITSLDEVTRILG